MRTTARRFPRRTTLRLLAVVPLVAVVLAACSHRRKPPLPATRPVATTTAPARPAQSLFTRPDLGIQLAIPAGWRAVPSDDYVLALRPVGNSAGAPPELSLDIPDLPFHIPGMIPIGAVRSGYLDDLRKQVGTMAVEDLAPPDVGGATARMVRSTWHPAPGQAASETALLLVHGDRVYILRARTDAGHDAETAAAFDALARSVQWVKPGK